MLILVRLKYQPLNANLFIAYSNKNKILIGKSVRQLYVLGGLNLNFHSPDVICKIVQEANYQNKGQKRILRDGSMNKSPNAFCCNV